MRELGRLFRTYYSDRYTRWGGYVEQVQDWLNFSSSSLTGYTPYELHFVSSLKDKIRSLLSFPEEKDDSHQTKIEKARQRIKTVGERDKRM